MSRRKRIKDIAEELNMSTSTVSRALTQHPDVSKHTRRMVMELAEIWDYQPDPLAVGLRRNKTYVIGVIVPQIGNRFFSKAISGIQEVARANGYRVMITQSEESLEIEGENLATMLNSRVDGLIVALSRETSNTSHFHKVFDSELPIVFFDRVDESHETSRVIIDDYEASYNAVNHLVSQGCKRIALVVGPQNLVNSKKRHDGYRDALADNQLAFDKDLLVVTEFHTSEVQSITEHFLSLNRIPDAIFAINDAFAIEMISYLKANGIAIPKDMAVVGFNNDVVGKFLDPPLTSVDSPAHDLGIESVKLLLSHIQSDELPATCKTLKSKLIVRESSLRL